MLDATFPRALSGPMALGETEQLHHRVVVTLVIPAGGFLCAVPSMVCAEDTATPELTNRLVIRGGWAYVFDAPTKVALLQPVRVHSECGYCAVARAAGHDLSARLKVVRTP